MMQLYSDLLFNTGVVQSALIRASHPSATAAPVFFYLFCVMGTNNRMSNFLKLENPPGELIEFFRSFIATNSMDSGDQISPS